MREYVRERKNVIERERCCLSEGGCLYKLDANGVYTCARREIHMHIRSLQNGSTSQGKKLIKDKRQICMTCVLN